MCGGADSTGDNATATTSDAASAAPDPCTLVDDSTLASYFGDEAVQGEPGKTGPLINCKWRSADANSLLVQVASDHALNRPDPCETCVDLSFGDGGYATESVLQSTAAFVEGSTWYSVTTTGFGDDAEAIADLAERIFHTATD